MKRDLPETQGARPVEIRATRNVTWCEERSLWRVDAVPARLELHCAPALRAAGWLGLRARLWRLGADLSAALIAQTEHGELRIALPVTLRGSLRELVLLPAGVQRLELEPMQSKGYFRLDGLQLHRPGVVQRYYTMWRRVLPLPAKLDRAQRTHLGLRWHSALTALPYAYAVAGRLRGAAPGLSYQGWLARFDQLSPQDTQRLLRQAEVLARTGPRIGVLLDVSEADGESVRASLESLTAQAYRHFDVIVSAASVETLALARERLPEARAWLLQHQVADYVKTASQPWFLTLKAGCRVAPHALHWFAAVVTRGNEAALLYSDHDHLGEHGERCEPRFKPDWSLELARSSGYPGQTLLVRADLLAEFLQGTQALDSYGLLLFVSAQAPPQGIVHVPAVLWHWPQSLPDVRTCPITLRRHLAERQVEARVEPDRFGHLRVRYALPARRPRVSIILPTRDRLDLLQPCLESVLEKTTYPEYEVLIIDNQSADAATLAYLAQCADIAGVRVLRYEQPFNFSAINNFGVSQASSELICLLNNDTEVISPDWLDEMVGRIIQPNVGAVGAKLYYADGRVQHAGDAVGPGGCANHLHGMLWRDDPGYMDRAVLAQELSAVTAACLLTWRTLFEALGGLDEQNLPVTFNDVDYCLRLNEAGKRVVFTPYAELYHYESLSRGSDDTPERIERARREVRYMRKRWKAVMRNDPFYNPNLSYAHPDFSLSHAPSVKRPW